MFLSLVAVGTPGLLYLVDDVRTYHTGTPLHLFLVMLIFNSTIVVEIRPLPVNGYLERIY